MQLIPVTARSMAWVCGHSLAGIAGSNPIGRNGCLSLVSVVCCQVEFSATGWSLVQSSLSECVSLRMIRCNNDPLHLRWVGIRSRTWVAISLARLVGINVATRACDVYLLTYSMVQSPSWEANWFAASQEISHISRNPKVHYRTHKRPPPISIPGQPNPVHIPTSHL